MLNVLYQAPTMFRIPDLTVSLLCLSSAIVVTNCHQFLLPLPRISPY
jgi:hypothetical protein